jgi:chemotaxis protein MotB
MFHANQPGRRGARTQVRSTSRRAALAAGALLTAVAVTSCASPQEIQQTRQVAKEYENQVFDLQRTLADLQMENARLTDRLAKERKASLINASADTSLTKRIDDLGRLIDEMEGPMGDIERFELDGGYLLMIQDRILFDSGSATLGDDGIDALAGIAAEISATPHGDIFVRGHTDSDPVKKPATLKRFPNGNLQLSAERAVSVAAYLIGNSRIRGSEVVVMGFGSHKPVRPNDSADAKRMNRRVEIFVSDPTD